MSTVVGKSARSPTSVQRGHVHAMDMNLFLEVDTGTSISAEKGATGDLLITDLSNFAMPLIRYRVGDRVTLGGACECGRALSTIREIGGRSYDYLADEAGRLYHGEAVMYVFEGPRRARTCGGGFSGAPNTTRKRRSLRGGADVRSKPQTPYELPSQTV